MVCLRDDFEFIVRASMDKLFYLPIVFLLSACSPEQELETINPTVIAKEIKHCVDHKLGNAYCDELKVVSKRVQFLSYSLSMDPQGYGQTILKLQEKIAEEQAALKSDNKTNVSQSDVTHDKQRLRERLAMLKWLASPRGKTQ